MKIKLAISLIGFLVLTVLIRAQSPATGTALKLTATSENVNGAGETIKINLTRWSTDAERDQLVAAWNLTAARGGAGGAARGGRGGATRGAAAPAATPAATVPDLPPDPAAAAAAPAQARGGAAGGGGGGRGGRGGGNGGGNAAPVTPAGSLLTALQVAPVAGYIWTSEVTGYAIHYAYKLPLPNGGQRIILATDRRLGISSGLWKPMGSAAPTDYEFTIVELRMTPKGDGEGKVSLIGKVTVETGSKSVALDGYDALPVNLKALKPQ